MWARLVADTRSRKQTFLAGALNRACLLDFRNGIARIGFTSDSQAARNEAEHAVRDIEAFLTAQAGRPVTLIFESAAPEQSAMSMASRERAQREDREDALRNACLDSDAVRLVKKMLGASVSQVMPNMDFGCAPGGTAFNDFVVDADDSADD